VAVCLDINTTRLSALYGRNVEFSNIKPLGTENNH